MCMAAMVISCNFTFSKRKDKKKDFTQSWHEHKSVTCTKLGCKLCLPTASELRDPDPI